MVCNPQERNLYELCWCFHCKVGTESSEPQQGTQLLGGFHVCHGFVTFRAPPLTQWMAPEPYPEFLVRFKVLFLWFLCLCMRRSYLTNFFSLSSYQNFWSQWFLANPVGIRLLSDWVCSSCKVPTWILQVCCGFAEESSVPRPHLSLEFMYRIVRNAHCKHFPTAYLVHTLCMEASDGPGDMIFPCKLVSFEHNIGLSICRLEAYRGFARSTHHSVKLTHDYTQQPSSTWEQGHNKTSEQDFCNRLAVWFTCPAKIAFGFKIWTGKRLTPPTQLVWAGGETKTPQPWAKMATKAEVKLPPSTPLSLNWLLQTQQAVKTNNHHQRESKGITKCQSRTFVTGWPFDSPVQLG